MESIIQFNYESSNSINICLRKYNEKKENIMKIKPTTVKGTYIKNISVSSTMGPGIKIDSNSFDK